MKDLIQKLIKMVSIGFDKHCTIFTSQVTTLNIGFNNIKSHIPMKIFQIYRRKTYSLSATQACHSCMILCNWRYSVTILWASRVPSSWDINSFHILIYFEPSICFGYRLPVCIIKYTANLKNKLTTLFWVNLAQRVKSLDKYFL